MTTTKTGASRSRGASARSEVNGKPKSITFRGLKLEVPAVAPGEILFDIGDNDVTGTLRTVLGEEQMLKLREKVAADKLSLPEAVGQLTDLLDRLFRDTYGVSSGE